MTWVASVDGLEGFVGVSHGKDKDCKVDLVLKNTPKKSPVLLLILRLDLQRASTWVGHASRCLQSIGLGNEK